MSDYIYISPIIGEISEEIYADADLPGVRGKISSAILFAEKIHYGIINGSALYKNLTDCGFNENISLSVVKLFVANDDVTSVLVSKGDDDDTVSYDYTYLRRLKKAGIKSVTIQRKYALETDVNVRPIRIEYIGAPPEIEVIEPIEPIEEIFYRSQATFTYTKGKKRVEIRIWYQSRFPIEEKTLIDKWNEANDNATKLPGANLGGLLDELEADPGFELNHEIEESEVYEDIGIWNGKLIFTDNKSGKVYTYKVL